MRGKQLSFLPKMTVEHGGNRAQGKRKSSRPIDPKRPLHVVLKSSQARGEWSMLQPKNRSRVDGLAQSIANRYAVRIYRYANVGNHLHLLVKTPSRRAFQGFLRELTGAIAMLISGARKGAPIQCDSAEPHSGRSFWDQLAYTRIVSWGREFRNIELYFIKNLFEAAGLLTRKAKAAGLRVIPMLGWGAPP